MKRGGVDVEICRRDDEGLRSGPDAGGDEKKRDGRREEGRQRYGNWGWNERMRKEDAWEVGLKQ